MVALGCGVSFFGMTLFLRGAPAELGGTSRDTRLLHRSISPSIRSALLNLFLSGNPGTLTVLCGNRNFKNLRSVPLSSVVWVLQTSFGVRGRGSSGLGVSVLGGLGH